MKMADGTEVIGAIYGFRSPNFAFDGPAIIRLDDTGKTFIADDDLAAALTELGPITTLDALSEALEGV